MKTIPVIIKDKTILELQEDAQAGDIIDLGEVLKVDTSIIERAIDSHKDTVYASRLQAVERQHTFEKEKIEAEHKSEKAKIEAEYKAELVKLVAEHQLELGDQHQRDLAKQNDLEKKIAELTQTMRDLETRLRLEIDQSWQKRVYELEAQIEKLKSESALSSSEREKEFILEKERIEKEYQEQIRKLDDSVAELRRQKNELNVKLIGEDLETWCDTEVRFHMQNGFFNCVWEKDNTVVRNEDEQKGTKADFIFSIFASKDHDPAELLEKICLEMKDERPDSQHKKKNEDYYRRLDENRTKKNCRYAVLVSALEADNMNSAPIYRVLEYPNMYVVRPAYLMVFINLIVSLTERYAYLIRENAQEELTFKTKEEILAKFEELKNTYLDKPLDLLKRQIEEISKQARGIIDSATKIEKAIATISNSYIEAILSKLDKFEIGETKLIKKIDSLS